MKSPHVHWFSFALLLAITSLAGAPPARAQWQYPPTRKAPVTEAYFGVSVVDNYRWLENVDGPEVKDWLKAQADLAKATLDRIPGRDSLMNDFVRLDAMKPANISAVTRKNGRYFYKKTLPSETVGRLYYRQGINGQETLLFDPAAGASGKSASISFFDVTEDGRRAAIGVAEQGSEAATVRILEVDTGKLDPESISPCWEGIGGWTRDGRGFTYNLMNSADVHDKSREIDTKSYFHVVGTDPKNDPEIFSRARYPSLGLKPEDFPAVSFSDDYQYIFGSAETVQNELTVFVAPAATLLDKQIPWKPLLKPEDAVTAFVTHGNTAYLLSHKDAPRYRVLSMSLVHPDVSRAVEILPQGANTMVGLERTRDYLLATTSDGINNRLFRYGYSEPKWVEITLPLKGTVSAGGFDITSNDAQAVITSWDRPAERYRFEAGKDQLTLSPLNVPASYPGTQDIVVEEVQVPSSGGALVPLSILYNRKLVRDGSASCDLEGYGAYGISMTPHFSILDLALINRGVVVAKAHVRGGGEKGFDWYHAGYKTTKPNTWNDFIACAEYLEKNKYTSASTLFGEGTSAGGILIGRSITERPDLFAAAICNVGCANAIRMENTPNGPINTPEFGTVKDSAECRALMEMDAVSHVKDGVKYPAVMCVGGANDPRVIVWQPAKFAAALQNATASGKPVLMQVNYDNGHFTEDKKVTFRNFANMFAFCLWQTGHRDFAMRN